MSLKRNFSFKYGLHVVELYLSSEVSSQDLAIRGGINNPALISKWVNDFQIVGPDALKPKEITYSNFLGAQGAQLFNLHSLFKISQHIHQKYLFVLFLSS